MSPAIFSKRHLIDGRKRGLNYTFSQPPFLIIASP